MKELSIEEKAKAYDEAIKRVENIKTGKCKTTFIFTEGLFEHIFPEFTESKDEKVRKTLVAFFTDWQKTRSHCWGISVPKILAWLEKQGGITKLSEEEQNKFAKGVLTSCALSFIDYLDAHKHYGKMCVSNGECEDIENAFHNAMWDRLHRYYCKYIEKQGDQKPKKCMYSNDNYTDEERKVLCEGCEEECEYNKKEEPVREDLQEAAMLHFKDVMGRKAKTGLETANMTSFKAGACWQKEKMLKDAIEREVHEDGGGYPYIDATEFYDYDKDIPLAKEGDKIKVIIVKED